MLTQRHYSTKELIADQVSWFALHAIQIKLVTPDFAVAQEDGQYCLLPAD